MHGAVGKRDSQADSCTKRALDEVVYGVDACPIRLLVPIVSFLLRVRV